MKLVFMIPIVVFLAIIREVRNFTIRVPSVFQRNYFLSGNSGIYEYVGPYRGPGPPPELATALGWKSEKNRVKESRKRKLYQFLAKRDEEKAKLGSKENSVPPTADEIEKLERSVLKKFHMLKEPQKRSTLNQFSGFGSEIDSTVQKQSAKVYCDPQKWERRFLSRTGKKKAEGSDSFHDLQSHRDSQRELKEAEEQVWAPNTKYGQLHAMMRRFPQQMTRKQRREFHRLSHKRKSSVDHSSQSPDSLENLNSPQSYRLRPATIMKTKQPLPILNSSKSVRKPVSALESLSVRDELTGYRKWKGSNANGDNEGEVEAGFEDYPYHPKVQPEVHQECQKDVYQDDTCQGDYKDGYQDTCQDEYDEYQAESQAENQDDNEAQNHAENRDENQYHPCSVEESDGFFSPRSMEDLNFANPQVIRNLAEMGIRQPTHIQQAAIAKLRRPGGCILHSHTGSGKTLAYLLPMVDRVDVRWRKVQGLVIVPTRELCMQIHQVCQDLTKQTGVTCAAFAGGANINYQLEKLRKDKPQIIVSTPGRLAELVFHLKKLSLRSLELLVLDEVDSLLHRTEQRKDLETLLQVMSPKPQTFCAVSATANCKVVKNFVEDYFGEPFDALGSNSTAAMPKTISHAYIATSKVKVPETLSKLLRGFAVDGKTLVFVNEPHRVDVICDKISQLGIQAAPLHGNSTKEDRKDIIRRFRDGRLNALVSTELSARGLDFPGLAHVVNVDLPVDIEHYIHRAGRCGRAGTEGLVVNIVCGSSKFILQRFARQLKVKVQEGLLRDGQLWLK